MSNQANEYNVKEKYKSAWGEIYFCAFASL